MAKGLSWAVFKVVCGLARLHMPRPEFMGVENLPEGPCVIVGNHAQMNGPVYAELYLPGKPDIWCNAQMMHLREVPDYAFQDFWSQKPARVRWLYRIASFLIAPVSVCVFNNARCIPVYHDMRLLTTLRQTLKRLGEGKRVVIFPEKNEPFNHILYAFQDRFIDLGKMYKTRAGEALCFVPMYVAPNLRRVIFGKPVPYEARNDPEAERARVCRALTDAITQLADSQPLHRVVPYRNMPKKLYPYNRPDERNRA